MAPAATPPKGGPPRNPETMMLRTYGPLLALAALPFLAFHLAVLIAGQLSGHAPNIGIGDTIGAILSHPTDPMAGYPASAGPLPNLVLTGFLAFIIFLVLGALATVGYVLWTRRRGKDGEAREGTATKAELVGVLGEAAVHKRAARDRPSLAGVKDLDFRTAAVYLGRDTQSNQKLWASHEDSFFVVGPPRSGKTVSLCGPLMLDAPGALVASSTKADLLMVGAIPRREVGPVLVFDPEDISGWPHLLRWSAVSGCEDPATAIRRADAMVAAKPMGSGGNTSFFTESAGTVLRCLLHAAALGGKNMRDVVRWANDFTDLEPLDILRGSPRAVGAWSEDLRTYTQGANETIASLKMTISLVLKSLSNPSVLEKCSPAQGEAFNVEEFITRGGTIFVLNSGGEGGSTAPLCTALVDDIVQIGKRMSQSTDSGRLDPPLRIVLDEAATGCPLPGLPTYMADTGGRGITVCACVQTFAQARARWGKEEAGQIFGASTTKIVLGGVPEADDLEQLSRLCGERDLPTTSSSTGPKGEVSYSYSQRRERVYTPTEIRQMPPGQGLLMYRNMPPIMARLEPWMNRSDAEEIKAGMKEARKMTGRS
ncbi:type IV secretion system protein VirD4 [Kitasatospora sp. GAS204A]|nr:type IV secretion system protein VirD4 [Kitasatospora sp. GAS204B]